MEWYAVPELEQVQVLHHFIYKYLPIIDLSIWPPAFHLTYKADLQASLLIQTCSIHGVFQCWLDLLARCIGMLNTSCSLWAVQANVARYFIISLVTYSLSQWKHVFFWTLTMNQEERKILPIGFWGTRQNKALLDAKCRAWGWFPVQSWVISYLKAD